LWLLLLWGLVLWMIITFRKVDRLAANLQLPYLLWLTFAAYLSAGVWLLNA
jgi:tryptophan-rich sensory protein